MFWKFINHLNKETLPKGTGGKLLLGILDQIIMNCCGLVRKSRAILYGKNQLFGSRPYSRQFNFPAKNSA